MNMSEHRTSIDLLYYSAWFGLLTGLIEGIGLFTLQRLQLLKGKIMYLGASYEIIWISMVFDLVLFLFVGLFLIILVKIFSSIPIKRIAILIFSFLLFFSWLYVIFSGRLALFAIFLLVLGLAIQISQWLYRRENSFNHFVRKTSRGMVSILVFTIFIIQGGTWLREEIALKKLPSASSTSPNILVIVVDALRADHLTSYGYDRNTAPNIESLAQQGTLFENAYSASSWTVPSHASLVTGRWPHEHGVDSDPVTGVVARMDGKLPTIGEELQSLGYSTAAFSGNFETFNRLSGIGRGFIHFEDYYTSFRNILVSSVYGRFFEYYGLHLALNAPYKIDRKMATDIDRSVLNWVGHDSGHPFFVFINYFDVHAPYIPPQPFRSQFSKFKDPGGIINTDWGMDHIYVPMTPDQLQGEIDAYDGGIAYVDYEIKQLLDGLKAQGKLDNTIVIITGDHGESFGEHGLLEHHNSLYREQVHIPLIIWWPSHIPQGERIDLPVSNVSLPATILDLIGSSQQNQFPVPSLVRTWSESQAIVNWPDPIAEVTRATWVPPQHLVFDGSMRSVITSQYQYIEHEKFGNASYDLRNDPKETNNLVRDPTIMTVLEPIRLYLEKLVSDP